MKYDIFGIHENSTTIEVQANTVSSLKKSEIKRYGVRRFENGKMFQASRLGEVTSDRLIADTREWGGPGLDHNFGFANSHQEARDGALAQSKHIGEFQDAVLSFTARHPEFVFSGKFSVMNVTTTFESNYDLHLKSSGGCCSWYMIYQRKGSGNVMDGYFSERSARPEIAKVLNSEDVYMRANLKEAKITAGRMPVLLVDTLAPLKKLVESMRINRYREGACLYAGKLGETLFSPEITLIDRAYVPEFGIYEFFDGEGSVRPQDDHILVDHGRFSNLISDLRFGKKYGAETTGNGIRPYNGGVNLGMRNLSMKPGPQTCQELLRKLDRCLVATVTAGGDSNDLGDYSSPVQVGYMFEKGELVGRAPQVTVKTSLARYLKNDLVAIASDSFDRGQLSPSLIAEMDVFLN